MRPIDADALCEECRGSIIKCVGTGCRVPTMQTIEAEPVKHGLWEHIRMLTTGDGRVKVGDCSSCKSTEKVRNYCPNCGCKMDLEGNNG